MVRTIISFGKKRDKNSIFYKVVLFFILLIILSSLRIPFFRSIPVFSSLGQGIRGSFENIVIFFNSKKSIFNENKELRSENELLKSKVAALLEELDVQNYEGNSVPGISAEVLTRSSASPFGTIIVSVGEEDGVFVGEEVFGGFSPIGKVSFVDKNISEVVLYTSPSSNFEAKLEDGTPVNLEGRGNNGFFIEVPRSVTAYPEMKIFKASDELYPVAEVVHISFDPRDPTQIIYAKPIVNIESLRFVTIKK